MCLIALAWQADPRYPLVMVANRDEFFARPTTAMASWPEDPGLYAGRDQHSGGTWLGLHREGRLAAVTNVREPAPTVALRSRGMLALDFLRGTQPAADYCRALESNAHDYAGFNLLMWDRGGLYYASNRPGANSHAVAPGIHGLSNAALNTPWPKLRQSRQWLADWLRSGSADIDPLLDAMTDGNAAPDPQLPDTGVGLARERLLSPAFIRLPGYGTRCTSFVAIDRNGEVQMIERSYGADGVATTVERHRFRLTGDLPLDSAAGAG